MKIDLKYFINKRNISLKNFCKLNSIKNYKDLLKYCEEKSMTPVSEEQFKAEVIPPPPPKPAVIAKKDNEEQTKTENKVATKKSTTTRRRSRTTRKKSESGTSSQKED